MKNTAFMRLLKQRADDNGRRMTVKKLAESAGVGRTHLTQVLHGTRPGPETRILVVPYLTEEEIKALGWKAAALEWERILEVTTRVCSTGNNVPGATTIQTCGATGVAATEGNL